MLETALWIAMACAACGAIAGNRAAWVLLPFVAYSQYLNWAEVPFSLTRWLIMDLSPMALVAYIAWGKRTPANGAIFALFFVGWAFYLPPDPYRYAGTMGVTILQLLLTFPARNAGQLTRRLVSRWKANFRHRDEWTELERRGLRGIDA